MEMITDMIQAGWALVPIPPGQKGPVQSGWNLPDQCIARQEKQYVLKGMNIGIAHAYCTPNPTCAIDIDNYKAARAWLKTHDIELKDLLDAPDAAVIWSGKKYSIKLLYRLPAKTEPIASTKINEPDGRVALEFRCATRDGKTVQDVLPPSTHPNGTQYQWLAGGEPSQLPEIPAVLLDLWRALNNNNSRVANRSFTADLSIGARSESPRQIAIIRDALSHINADCSYETWRNIVWAILSTRWTCAEAIAKAWSQTAPDRYAENEDAFWTLVNSYMPNRSNPITVGTIFHHARLGGWHG